MVSYADVLQALDLPSPVVRCADGSVQPPHITMRAPAEWYVFPPVLIPIWSDTAGPSYIGYWRHWFLDREPTYVELNVDSDCMTIEIARTPEQLFADLAMQAIANADGVTDTVRRFAREVGIENLEELDRVSLVTGDDPKGFWQIEQFRTKVPLASVSDVAEYTGDFPTGALSGLREWWGECCSCELSADYLARWPASIERPDWLREGQDMPGLFDRYLRGDDLGRAWLTLNSTGWLIRDARAALAALRDAARDDQFSLVCSAWLSITEGDPGDY